MPDTSTLTRIFNAVRDCDPAVQHASYPATDLETSQALARYAALLHTQSILTPGDALTEPDAFSLDPTQHLEHTLQAAQTQAAPHQNGFSRER